MDSPDSPNHPDRAEPLSPAPAGPARYCAFISYSHHDRRWASWLHRQIETYRLPSRLLGRSSPIGPLGRRLPPVFQDREELASSADLAGAVRSALAEASALIVICSPSAAASRWVNEEVRYFIDAGRRDRIQCLVVHGDPGASRRPPRDGVEEAFPPALLIDGIEPLAADVRPTGDGRSAAKLKLIAGILGLPYDELRRREAARRQRRLVVVAVASMVGLLVTSALAIYALIARGEAVRERDIARRRTLTAERTVDFVKSMFAVSDPSEAKGATVTARDLLRRGGAQLDQGLANEPAVRADLGTTLGQVYLGLGLFKEGEREIRRTFAFNRSDLPVLGRQYAALGEAQADAGDFAAAGRSYREALKLDDASGGMAEPALLVGLGSALSFGGNPRAATPVLRRALLLDRQRGAARPDLARDLEALATNSFNAGDQADAKSAADRALALRIAAQGPLHPRVADDLNLLGTIAYQQRDNVAAAAYFTRVLKADEIVLGPDHPDLASTLNNLARILLEQRRFAQATRLLERSAAIAEAQRGAEHPELAFTYANLGLALRGIGRLKEAEQRMVEAQRVAAVTHSRNLAPVLADLADMRCSRGDVAGGLSLLATARPLMNKTYPDDPWRVAWVDNVRAGCLARKGDRAQAALLWTRSLPAIEARWAPDTLYGTIARARPGA